MSLTNMNPFFSNSSTDVVAMLSNNACTVKHPDFKKQCYSYVLHLSFTIYILFFPSPYSIQTIELNNELFFYTKYRKYSSQVTWPAQPYAPGIMACHMAMGFLNEANMWFQCENPLPVTCWPSSACPMVWSAPCECLLTTTILKVTLCKASDVTLNVKASL